VGSYYCCPQFYSPLFLFVYFLICVFFSDIFAIAAGAEEYSPVPGAQSGGKRGDKAGLLASAW
jgi:hypothetical protein